jgi:hypothetical protein
VIPGQYTLPEADYFAAPGVSNSLLRQMRLSPAHARAYLDRQLEAETEAQRLGKLIHRGILEPARLAKVPVRPAGMDFRSKDGKAWRDANPGFVTADEMTLIRGIVASVYAHPAATEILTAPEAKTEQSLFAVDEETGLALKGRLDWLTPGYPIVDIKSTRCSSPELHGFVREIAYLRYHVQAAFYTDLCARLKIPVTGFLFLAIEKEPPYASTLIQLDDMSINKGRDEYRRLLRLYKDCQDRNAWPAYSDRIEPVTLPMWALSEKPFESAYSYELRSFEEAA